MSKKSKRRCPMFEQSQFSSSKSDFRGVGSTKSVCVGKEEFDKNRIDCSASSHGSHTSHNSK